MSRSSQPVLPQSLGRLPIRFVMTVMCSGAFALYAVGTGWYWHAVRQLPRPLVSSMDLVLVRARSLLADDTSVAERQADFYEAWFLVCCVALLGWIDAAVCRRVWPDRKARAA